MARLALPSLALLLLFCTAGCSPEPPELDYVALPAVRYLADTRELRAQLVVYEGDSLETAVMPTLNGPVQFMDQLMEVSYRSDSTARYGALLRADFGQPLRFTIPFAEGGAREILLQVAPASLEGFPDTIRRDEGLRFVGTPDSLSRMESMLIHFQDSARQIRQVLIAGPSRDSILSAPAASLSHIEAGTYDLYLVKQWEGTVQQGSIRVQGLVEYYTGTKQVRVE